MTSIGKSDGGAIGQWSDVPGNRYPAADTLDEVARRSSARTGLGGGLLADLGTGLQDQTIADGRAAFEKSLRDAARTIENETDDGAGKDMPSDAAPVLAVAEGIAATGLPAPADAAAPACAPLPPAAETIVARVKERIEQAIRAEAAPIAGRPLNVRLDFSGEIAGLKSIRIVATPTALDVVLERAESAISSELLEAAQALAERLVARCSMRTVRVLDLPTRAGKASSAAGIHMLSDLFRGTSG